METTKSFLVSLNIPWVPTPLGPLFKMDVGLLAQARAICQDDPQIASTFFDQIRDWAGLGKAQCRLPPYKGPSIRITVRVPIKGRGFINHGSTLPQLRSASTLFGHFRTWVVTLILPPSTTVLI